MLVIDDGSTDGTAATARSLLTHLPHHTVISLPSNQGKGAAVRTGVARARGGFTAYMDADMAIDPRAIPCLGQRPADRRPGHRVPRTLADSMVESTYAVRSVMGQLFNRLVTTGTGLGLRDTQCGFKAFRTPAARLLFHLVRIDRFAFDVEILARAQQLGLSIAEVPVQWRHVAGSTVHPLYDSVTMLSDVWRSRLGLIPTPPVPCVTMGPPKSSGFTSWAPCGRPRLKSPRGHHAAMDDRPGRLRRSPVPWKGRVRSHCSTGWGAWSVAHRTAVPFRSFSGGGGAIVLLPLIDPSEAAGVLAALRAELPDLSVTSAVLDRRRPGRSRSPGRPSRRSPGVRREGVISEPAGAGRRVTRRRRPQHPATEPPKMAPFGGSTMQGMTADPSDPTPTASRSGRTGTRSSPSTGSDGRAYPPRRVQPRVSVGTMARGTHPPEPERASGRRGRNPSAAEVDIEIMTERIELTEQPARSGGVGLLFHPSGSPSASS